MKRFSSLILSVLLFGCASAKPCPPCIPIEKPVPYKVPVLVFPPNLIPVEEPQWKFKAFTISQVEEAPGMFVLAVGEDLVRLYHAYLTLQNQVRAVEKARDAAEQLHKEAYRDFAEARSGAVDR